VKRVARGSKRGPCGRWRIVIMTGAGVGRTSAAGLPVLVTGTDFGHHSLTERPPVYRMPPDPIMAVPGQVGCHTPTELTCTYWLAWLYRGPAMKSVKQTVSDL
jgi:hypothetical protein